MAFKTTVQKRSLPKILVRILTPPPTITIQHISKQNSQSLVIFPVENTCTKEENDRACNTMPLHEELCDFTPKKRLNVSHYSV